MKYLLTSLVEELKQDKGLNANKYFGIFKLCIETKDAKLIETSIYHIHVIQDDLFIEYLTITFRN